MNAFLFLLLTALTVPLCGCGRAAAPPYQSQGVAVEFVSEVTAVRPGQPFYTGLSLKHAPDYHTYWLNPGLAGVPTKMEWSLPEGWTAGDIEWPAPDKVLMASIRTHGFERDVVLMVKLTPPAKLPAGNVVLKTKGSWMCCAKTCNPDWHDFTLTLPVQDGEGPAWDRTWHPLFEKERKTFPVPVKGWKFDATRKGNKILLTGQPDGTAVVVPEEPVFFSTDNLICSHPAQVWRKKEKGFEAELEVSELPPDDETVLRGVLRGKSGWNAGDNRAVTIEVKIR